MVPESNRILKEMGAPDTIEWTQAYAGTLYNFKNTLEGVGDGLADIGWVGTLWEPVKMPLMNVTYTPLSRPATCTTCRRPGGSCTGRSRR